MTDTISELSMNNMNETYFTLKYVIPFSKMTGQLNTNYVAYGVINFWSNKTDPSPVERSTTSQPYAFTNHKCFRPVMNIKYEK